MGILRGLADRYAEQDADMSNASNILQKANLNLEQRIEIQKSLTAQLRQIVMNEKEIEKLDKEKEQKPASLFETLAGIF